MPPPPRFEGTKNHEEWLEECTPELAGDSESEDLCESDATDHEGTSDEEDEEKADEEQVERMLRTNGADKCEAQKSTRGLYEPPTSEEVHPPRQNPDDMPSLEKVSRRPQFPGKGGESGKVRRCGGNCETYFCPPGAHARQNRGNFFYVNETR